MIIQKEQIRRLKISKGVLQEQNNKMRAALIVLKRQLTNIANNIVLGGSSNIGNKTVNYYPGGKAGYFNKKER